MDCRLVQNSMSNYIDGLMVDQDVHLLEGHLSECSHCHSLKLELSAVRTAARELPLQAPPRALWTRIQNEIELEVVSEQKGATPVRSHEHQPQSWWSGLRERKFSFSLPQLAGAGALAMLLLGVSMFGAYRQGSGKQMTVQGIMDASVLPEEQKLRKQVEDLKAEIEPRKAAWDPALREIFDTSFSRIDKSLDECRRNLAEKPEDGQHRERVRELYQEQIELLEAYRKMK
jgi:hypothetical protein